MNYTRTPQRFVSRGMDLNHPTDLMPAGKFPFLRNVRSFQDGRLESRPGLEKVNTTPLGDLNIHTVFRMNDYVAADFVRFLGAGTNLYSGQTFFSEIDSGYSGNPLSVVPFVPLKSVSDWAYIADANRLRKANSSGTNYQMGITPPNIIPIAELLPPAYIAPGSDSASPFNAATGAWGHNGSVSQPQLNPTSPGAGMPGRLVTCAIDTILYISGTTGWACVAPTAGATDAGATQIVAGMRMQIGSNGSGTAPPTVNNEFATVEEVHKIYPVSGVTIGSIIYDNPIALTGLCTISPSAPMAGIARNSMLELASEYVRVISVTNGDNGVSSFRCSTTGTHVGASPSGPGDAITPPANGSFWIYLTLTHLATEWLWCSVQQFQLNNGSGVGGQIYNNTATGGPYYQMAIAGGRPITMDDYFHLSIWVDNPQYLIQGQIILDVDSGTIVTHATTDGTRNAYVFSFKGSDLQQYIANLQTNDTLRPGLIQDLLQAETAVSLPTALIPPAKLGAGQSSQTVDVASTAASNPPAPVLADTTSQLYTGDSQWTELRVPLSSFIRIGSDQTADLTAIHAIIFNFTMQSGAPATFMSLAGMWTGGTYGPDTGVNLTPMMYRYRYRASTIGCVSIPGPALRSGVTTFRQGVLLTATASTDPQVDKIDWERLGGPNTDVNGVPDWHYLGTCDNVSPSIIDDQYSAAIEVNAPLDTDTYVPFTVVGKPLSLMASYVAGTAIQLDGDGGFNVPMNLVPGTEVLVNGILTEVYALPSPTGSPITAVVDKPVSGGGGYASGDTGLINTGDGTATYEVLTVNIGEVETLSITFGGTTGYTTGADNTTTATTGAGSGLLLELFATAGVVISAILQVQYGGSDYAVGDTGNISDGDGSAVYTVTAVDAYGSVTAVTLSSGDLYTVAIDYPTSVLTGSGSGTLILNVTQVNSTLFHVADSMISGYSNGSGGIPLEIEIQEPTIMGTPLPVIWGPFQNTLFACGNPLNAGGLYFTKPNDPDSSADTNYISVSSPSEILMNGCVYDSKCYAFSDRRLFQVIPGQANTFAFNEVMNGKGLVSRWALTVGPKIWFVANDGVYEIAGGEAPTMISTDIRPLFPQGDNNGISVNGLNAIDTGAPIKLVYYNNYLFMDYQDSTGALLTLVYDTLAGGWYSDEYAGGNFSLISHCAEYSLTNASEAVDLLGGANNGFLYSAGGFKDDNYPILWEIDTPAFNAGDFRAFKQFGDNVFDVDTQGVEVTVNPWLNNYTTQHGLSPFTFSSIDREITPPLTFPVDTFAQNLAWKITGQAASSTPKIYGWEPAFFPRPEISGNRATDWDDAQYQGNKFFQGFVLEADTFGQKRTINIEVDFQVVATISVNHAGHLMLPYVIDPAFTGHMIRIVPDDADEWSLYSVKWVWEPAPEFVTYWETQTTNHDIPGYQFVKEAYIALNSTAPVTLTVSVDGTIFTAIIPSTGGVYAKTYLIFPSLVNGRTLKGKLFKYILSSAAPFQLFQRDSEVRVHAWISSPTISGIVGQSGYLVKQPFGDVSRVGGARI